MQLERILRLMLHPMDSLVEIGIVVVVAFDAGGDAFAAFVACVVADNVVVAVAVAVAVAFVEVRIVGHHREVEHYYPWNIQVADYEHRAWNPWTICFAVVEVDCIAYPWAKQLLMKSHTSCSAPPVSAEVLMYACLPDTCYYSA